MIVPIIMAYIGDLTPPGQEGSYMGLYNMAMFLGIAAGPILGGVIVDHGGTRSAFITLAGLMGIAFFIILLFLPAHRPTSKTHIAHSPLKKSSRLDH